MASALALALALTAAVPSITSYRQPGQDGRAGGHSEQALATANPTAVLAWAKINCFGGLELASTAPRTQMEIILQVAAAYDADSRRRNIADTCTGALAAAKRVIAKDSAPAVTGERPLYEKAVSERTGKIITR